MAFFEYDYVPKEEHYIGINLKGHSCVDAQYVPSPISLYKGNPLIEALPLPLPDDEIKLVYSSNIPGFNQEEVPKMTDSERLMSVMTLRKWRISLPYHKTLEQRLYTTLIGAYQDREILYSPKSKQMISIEGKNELVKTISKASQEEGTGEGLCLLGNSGCGKSSSLGLLLNHIPQVIWHHPDENTRFAQIVYITANCIAGSNMRALYDSLAASIDEALGNSIEPYFAEEMRRKRTLGDKQRYLCRLIEIFSIGIIFLDEIQLIDFDNQSERSFQAFMTISNITKVAIAVLGTPEAKLKMFGKLQNVRRIGAPIQCDLYCHEVNYIKLILKDLFKYQWIDDPIPVPKKMTGLEAQEFHEIANVFYEESKGLIDQIVRLFQYVQFEWIRAKKKPKIDASFIQKVSEKNFSNLKPYLGALDDAEAERKRKKLSLKADEFLNSIADQESQKIEMEKASRNVELNEEMSELIDFVVDSISLVFTEFDDSLVRNTAVKVVKSAGIPLSKQEAIKRTRNLLEEQKKPARRKSKSAIKPAKDKHEEEIEMKNVLKAFVLSG